MMIMIMMMNDDSRLALVGLLKYYVYQALRSVSESGTPS